MSNTVTITIDDQQYEVPAGMNLVDVAKWHADNDIPVFCYHPKMDPVGMCRMCIVELGTIEKDRETGEVVLDEDGNPNVRWFPKLQTACTQLVSDGLVVRTQTETVHEARNNVVEFLLTSHPLDCPICDKGGECPLQNLTMAHGPGQTRMDFSDKMKLDKHVPLGDLIFLDEERCIQCARCIRFQDEIVGDDVLAFHERGRSLQIITNSDPGFDTYFSGNTTDICPVGALTTADFRFGARPWELTEVPSICPYSPAGVNISLSTRLDRDFGGRAIIKRVMPRQNEFVNEIWISDKTRFGHHFTRSEDRLTQPMMSASPTTWNEGFAQIASHLQAADGAVAAIAGSGATNEDLWELKQLLAGLGSERLGAWPPSHAGGDIIAQVGVGLGTNLSELGSGDAILVIANDLEEEVPIWRLRIKQAQDRGAYLVVANARPTRMEELALDGERYGNTVAGDAIRYRPGEAAHIMNTLAETEIGGKLAQSKNLIIVAGAEGLGLDGSRALMEAAANFLIQTGHVGKSNCGLLSTAPGPNPMGLHYLGYTPENTQQIAADPPSVLVVLQAELLEDEPSVADWIDQVDTVICLSLFPDKLAQGADFALPIQSFAERDGTYTSADRRVQRFYTAQGPLGSSIPAWKALGEIGQVLGQGRPKLSAAAVMLEITKNVPEYAGARYKELAKVERQFPDVGGDDLYYGGTAYQNKAGLGVQIPTTADSGESMRAVEVKLPGLPKAQDGQWLILPTVRLYNRQNMFRPSIMVHPRVMMPYAEMSPEDARQLSVGHGNVVEVAVAKTRVRVRVAVNASLPAGMILLPRHMSDTATPIVPMSGSVTKVAEHEPELEVV